MKIHFPFLRPDLEPIDLAKAVTGDANDFADAREVFTSAAIENTDVVVYPYGAHVDSDELRRASELAKGRNLPFACLAWGDRDITQTIPYGRIYCESLDARDRAPCQYAKPGFCADPFAEVGRAPGTRPWTPRPSVGFCGFVSNPLLRTIYRLSGRQRKALGLALRARALRALNRPGVDCHFIRRTFYWAGTTSRFHHNAQGQVSVRREFLDNLLDSDYTLCIRGAGNYSYRFSEALAAGRIPLFVNTRCVLPFENEIDWRKHCVWVEESELPNIAKILLDFHARLNDDQFRALQQANRRLWEERLERLAFYKHAFAPSTLLA